MRLKLQTTRARVKTAIQKEPTPSVWVGKISSNRKVDMGDGIYMRSG